jgi:hypothetical protein
MLFFLEELVGPQSVHSACDRESQATFSKGSWLRTHHSSRLPPGTVDKAICGLEQYSLRKKKKILKGQSYKG